MVIRWRLTIVALCLGIFLLSGCGTRHKIPARPADSTPLTPAEPAHGNGCATAS